jgi:catechol 2,3-dioxygenase-like lactoylglutathione lyase family enzyme
MASPFHPRISLITLGVSDLARARAFYEALGLVAAPASQGDVVFFQLNGMALALFPRAMLAADAHVPPDGSGFSGITLAQNHASPEAVDAAMAHAVACGGTLVKPAETVFWGGYSGYVADPDGHLWEFAFNPFFPLDAAGNLSLE